MNRIESKKVTVMAEVESVVIAYATIASFYESASALLSFSATGVLAFSASNAHTSASCVNRMSAMIDQETKRMIDQSKPSHVRMWDVGSCSGK